MLHIVILKTELLVDRGKCLLSGMLFWEEVVGTVWVDESAKGFVFSPHFCFSSPQYSCSD